MNFDHFNKVSDHFRDKLLPHLKSLVSVDFSMYLSKISEYSECKWIRTDLRSFSLNYFVDPEAFVKKYQKKCVTYLGTTNPNDGAVHIIYQISPEFHVLARLFHWIENEEIVAYLTLTCVYRNLSDYMEFFDENKNLRLTGNTDERTVGFRPVSEEKNIPGNFMEHLASLAKES